MIKCLFCQYGENPDNALVCVKCGQPIKDPQASIIRRPTGLLSRGVPMLEPRLRNQHFGKLKRHDIAIYVADMEEPLITTLTHDLMLGRYGGTTVEQQPHIDLAAFAAIDHGVSRRHALLRRFGLDVAIVDLGSTNGTWLNGMRIQPHQPVTLRSADRLFLAHLPIQIYLP